MSKFKSLILAGAAVLALGTSALAPAALADGHTKTVGGAVMSPDKTIVENASASADHTTLVAAVKAAGLVETLSSEGPFTVFAPVNSGFAALPAGTVDTLLKPENKGLLTKVLTAHVVAGKVMAGDLLELIKKGHGYTNITTVSGDTITARVDGKGVYIFDESGGVSRVTIADVNQSNGVIHVVDNVLVPK